MSLEPVRPRQPLYWLPDLERLCAAIPPDQVAYIVGGAVRDALLQRSAHDLDLATPGDGRPLARHLANTFGGAYYSLDAARGVGRALIPWEGGQLVVDVAQFRGPDLLADLQNRDFTINALAVRASGDLQAIIDPLRGLRDLDARIVRQCGPDSIPSDPVRALRAVRASVTFGCRIEPDTREAARAAAPRLAQVSVERVRDEFINVLAGPNPSGALDALQRLGLLAPMIPEAEAMQGVEQGPPHQFPVWRHTLVVLERLETILQLLQPHRSDNVAASAPMGLIVSALAGLRAPLEEHVAHLWPNQRPHRALLMLAALLHDSGKPATRSVEEDGRVRFLEHERRGETLALHRANALRLSNDEITRLATIVRHHMRPHWLASDGPPTARAIYRFWRDTGAAGVDICLLAMADYLATYANTLEIERWTAYLSVIRSLLENYLLRYDSTVAPTPLLNGNDLMQLFPLEPGRPLGELLEALREAQAAGEIHTREEALALARRFVERS